MERFVEGKRVPLPRFTASQEELERAKQAVENVYPEAIGNLRPDFLADLTAVSIATQRLLVPESSSTIDESNTPTNGADTPPPATTSRRRMTLGRIVLSGAVGTMAVSEFGFIGYMMWNGDQKTRAEARRMQEDKVGTTLSDPTPQGWQFAYLPRNPNIVFEVAGPEDSVVRVNSWEPIRLSKTLADWTTDIKVYVKDNGYYRPYWRAVGLGVEYPNKQFREAFLREIPSDDIDNQVLHFVNRKRNLETYVSIEPTFTSVEGRTRAHFDVTPLRLRG